MTLRPCPFPLRLPVFAAPMFLISGPALVLAACEAGIIGAFPTPNARPIAQLDLWMREIHPYLTHRDPLFMEYETALRAKTPLSADAQLALAQGLHARLGAASPVGRLTPELAQMIGQISTVANRRRKTFHNF